MCKSFVDFVVIKLRSTSPASIDHKAMKTFVDALGGDGADGSLRDTLGRWLVRLIERGVSLTVRKRYFGKLRQIFLNYLSDCQIADEQLFEVDARLLDYEDNSGRRECVKQVAAKLYSVFGQLMTDSRDCPELAVLAYMLLECRFDINRAVMLTCDDYEPSVAQMKRIVDTTDFHHRRKYLFSLGQNRVRAPRIVKDTLAKIEGYLSSKGLRLKASLTGETIAALWIAKAMAFGVKPQEIRSMFERLPRDYDYLTYLPPSEIDDARRNEIIAGVADSLCPMTNKWYAMRLRRGVSLEDVNSCLTADDTGPRDIEFFYPCRTVARRVGRKLLKESVPYIPDIAFFSTIPLRVREIDRRVKDGNLGWVYRVVNTPDSEYSVISGHQMLRFERAIGQFSEDMRLQLVDKRHMEIDSRVCINSGIMAGYEGNIFDIKQTPTDRLLYIKLSTSNYLKIEVCINSTMVDGNSDKKE